MKPPPAAPSPTRNWGTRTTTPASATPAQQDEREEPPAPVVPVLLHDSSYGQQQQQEEVIGRGGGAAADDHGDGRAAAGHHHSDDQTILLLLSSPFSAPQNRDDLLHQHHGQSEDSARTRTFSSAAQQHSTSTNNNVSVLTTTRFAFPYKLHQLLNDAADEGAEHIVSWASHGRAFKIHSKQHLEALLLPRYFTNNQQSPGGGQGAPKFRSFQRQLGIYGFELIKDPLSPDCGTYHHPLFRRGQIGLCAGMIRRKIKCPRRTSDDISLPFVTGGDEEKKRPAAGGADSRTWCNDGGGRMPPSGLEERQTANDDQNISIKHSKSSRSSTRNNEVLPRRRSALPTNRSDCSTTSHGEVPIEFSSSTTAPPRYCSHGTVHQDDTSTTAMCSDVHSVHSSPQYSLRTRAPPTARNVLEDERSRSSLLLMDFAIEANRFLDMVECGAIDDSSYGEMMKVLLPPPAADPCCSSFFSSPSTTNSSSCRRR